MINIIFYTNRDRIVGFKISGHSNYYKRISVKIRKSIFGINEKDHICAAVSAVAYMTVIGLKRVLKKTFFFKQDDRTGYMEVCLTKEIDKSSEILLNSLRYMLDEIDKEYPKNLKIRMEEKNGS